MKIYTDELIQAGQINFSFYLKGANTMNDSYINFLAAELFASISLMNAANQQRMILDQSLAYGEEDYFAVIDEYKQKLENYLKNNGKRWD